MNTFNQAIKLELREILYFRELSKAYFYNSVMFLGTSLIVATISNVWRNLKLFGIIPNFKIFN
jgi:hypothetical protein